MKHECIKNIKGYTFKTDDEENVPFLKELITACRIFNHKYITDNPNVGMRNVPTTNMLSHYEVNQLTGEKFLRLAVREWKTS